MTDSQETEAPEEGAQVDITPLCGEDLSRLEKLIESELDPTSKEKIRSVLKPGGMRKVLGSSALQSRAVEDALMISDRWDPRNTRTEKQLGPNKEVVALSKGDARSIEEVEMDAMYMAAINVKISMLWAVSKTAVSRAEAHLSMVKASAKRVVSEARRSGFLRGKVKSNPQSDNLALTTKSVREAEEDLLSIKEQSEILGSCYFATKDLSDVLMQRARSLRSDAVMSTRQPN
jgi:hypothetical protein